MMKLLPKSSLVLAALIGGGYLIYRHFKKKHEAFVDDILDELAEEDIEGAIDQASIANEALESQADKANAKIILMAKYEKLLECKNFTDFDAKRAKLRKVLDSLRNPDTAQTAFLYEKRVYDAREEQRLKFQQRQEELERFSYFTDFVRALRI